ncbi:MAG TPA: quinone-dependent dihydroorotate dehydrogenase [Rhodobacteraceae bacterium]|nr:quinone-dependent dihydroorotate dehydrogenase [Paracoccaceae bacterium]
MEIDPFPLLKLFLFRLDAERAHDLTISMLETGLFMPRRHEDDPRLRQTLFGRDFPNPLGMAAGFDKNARVADALLRLGFGFVEVGTVTPRPQNGNPKPRLFRLPEDEAVINRMGFNNEGLDALTPRLRRRRQGGIVGVNIGANKDSADRIADYVTGLEAVQALADYITVNISSPNTPGLRDLQGGEALDELLGRLQEVRRAGVAAGKPATPLGLKVAPDLTDAQIGTIAARALHHRLDGLIVGNTTLGRPGLLDHRHARESGGLSGAPLFDLSTRVLARFYLETGGKIPLIGAGGLSSGAGAMQKILAGASLLQLYTALIYQGPRLIGRIKKELVAALDAQGYATLHDATGAGARAMADPA